ncbi:MAG: hypothetical protein QM758_27230 [Armatimonas sp.]
MGWWNWGKDLLSRIPDTWVGAMGTYALVGTGLSLLRLPWTLWEMLQASPKTFPSLSPTYAAWSLASTFLISGIVGYLQPKRGWVAPLIQAITLGIGILIGVFSNSKVTPGIVEYSTLFASGALAASAMAYFIGRKRRVAP